MRAVSGAACGLGRSDMTTAFQYWVANTIDKCGGNGAEYLRCIERKCLLTFAVSRMGACQEVFSVYFDDQFLECMRPAEIVSADFRVLH